MQNDSCLSTPASFLLCRLTKREQHNALYRFSSSKSYPSINNMQMSPYFKVKRSNSICPVQVNIWIVGFMASCSFLCLPGPFFDLWPSTAHQSCYRAIISILFENGSYWNEAGSSFTVVLLPVKSHWTGEMVEFTSSQGPTFKSRVKERNCGIPLLYAHYWHS